MQLESIFFTSIDFNNNKINTIHQTVFPKSKYIQGKVKNIRTECPPSYFTVAFAFLMAYIDEFRGDYLFDHPSVKALDTTRNEILALIKAAADRELLDYNRSGASIVISFDKIEDASGNMIRLPKDKIAVIDGLKDYIIVDKEEVLMIYPKSKEQSIKSVLAEVKKRFGDQYI
jgi:hypothetical protein